jgi:lipopolysaccharide/colanic/teichoic acid biosynthesis glycosyltransferase
MKRSHRVYDAVKRVADLLVSALLLLVLSPVLAVLAILVRAKVGHPVLFRQQRPGRGGRLFTIYKFRTMRPAPEGSGAVESVASDPERLTGLGRFLRASSLDELPELFNVLRGDMSLVGPRPLPERDFKGFNIDWHRRRFSVKPGLTCLWQVSGRNHLTFEEWMALDLKYIDNWSPLLDAKILLRTVPAVFLGKGAS